MQYLGGQVQLVYDLPMNEVVLDFSTVSSLSAGVTHPSNMSWTVFRQLTW